MSNKLDICRKVTIAVGLVSYEGFSTNIMIPKSFSRLCGDNDLVVGNCLWLNAHIGIGVYLYNSCHLQKAPTHWRLMYSVYGSVLFNFGSVLLWGTWKHALSEFNSAAAKGVFAVSSGLLMLYIGQRYVEYIDSQSAGS